MAESVGATSVSRGGLAVEPFPSRPDAREWRREPATAVGLLLLMSGLIVRSFSLAKTRLTPAFAAVVLKPNAIIGALAGTMVAETVYELLHVRQVWTLFAIVAGLVIWGRD